MVKAGSILRLVRSLTGAVCLSCLILCFSMLMMSDCSLWALAIALFVIASSLVNDAVIPCGECDGLMDDIVTAALRLAQALKTLSPPFEYRAENYETYPKQVLALKRSVTTTLYTTTSTRCSYQDASQFQQKVSIILNTKFHPTISACTLRTRPSFSLITLTMVPPSSLLLPLRPWPPQHPRYRSSCFLVP